MYGLCLVQHSTGSNVGRLYPFRPMFVLGISTTLARVKRRHSRFIRHRNRIKEMVYLRRHHTSVASRLVCVLCLEARVVPVMRFRVKRSPDFRSISKKSGEDACGLERDSSPQIPGRTHSAADLSERIDSRFFTFGESLPRTSTSGSGE